MGLYMAVSFIHLFNNNIINKVSITNIYLSMILYV